MRKPAGCDPGRGCFSCTLPDCSYNGGATKKEADIMKAGLGGNHNVAVKNGKAPAVYTAGVTGRMSLEYLAKSWMMGGTLY